MQSMNAQMDMPQLQAIMRQFEMQSDQLEQKQEMMEDAMDSALDEGDEDEEADEDEDGDKDENGHHVGQHEVKDQGEGEDDHKDEDKEDKEEESDISEVVLRASAQAGWLNLTPRSPDPRQISLVLSGSILFQRVFLCVSLPDFSTCFRLAAGKGGVGRGRLKQYAAKCIKNFF